MKKIFSIVVTFLLISTTGAFAKSYTSEDINKAWGEIKSNTELMNELQRVNSDKSNINNIISALEKNRDVSDMITKQLINDPKFLEKILLNMGQESEYAKELTKDSQTRSKLIDKIDNDPQLMDEVWNSIIEKNKIDN